VFDSAPFFFNTVPPIVSAPFGSDTLFVLPANALAMDYRKIFTLVDVGTDGTVASTALVQLPAAQLETSARLASIELFPGDGGAWIGTTLLGGELRIGWLTSDQILHPMMGMFYPWIQSPLGANVDYVAAFPIATHGTDVAIAFRLGDTNWQIMWVTPDPASSTVDYSGSRVVAGPTFTLPSDTVRPGGLYDHDRLLLVGAQESTPGHADAVSVSSVAWGAPASAMLTPLAAIPKISQAVPRRLAVAQTGSRLAVAWTERISANEEFGEYTALYSATIAEP
jgi:hypothetical protein